MSSLVRAYDGIVRVEQWADRGMISLKGDLGDSALHALCTGLTGVDFPGTLQANCVGEAGLCWMAPDELLLLMPHDRVAGAIAKIDEVLGGKHHLAADVSDARSLFLVSGGSPRDVMAKLTPVDVSPRNFSPGQFRRTRLAQVPAAFWMRDETTFEVIAFRSVGDYVFNLLSTAADPAAVVDFHA